MSKVDPEILAHREWINFVQPTGLVFSAPALSRAGAILDRRDAEGQRLLRACLTERTFNANDGPEPFLPDFPVFATSVLGWNFSPKGYAGTEDSPIPPELELPLPSDGVTLRPDYAVRERSPQEGKLPWQLLVQVLDPGEDFDRIARGKGQLEASPHSRMERLLRHTDVSAGLLFNGRALRLVSAPRGESSGWLDFRVADMMQTAGRPISTALRLLLGQPRLLSLPPAQRLASLLVDSRKFQNEVSERLAEQVLHALYELLRGFQSAHDASKGELLRQPLTEHPDEVYRALLTVVLRLVFLLYAEERDMLPEDETFLRYYSLAGLYERLREDAALFPDTMDQRYGAWAQLLALFRMVYDGADCGKMHLPERHGVLFDPERFPFLEGRNHVARQIHERIEVPLVPDGTIYRALEKLLVLDGERISYRALDVEQIGSVYETMMGFRLETASGRSVAIKAAKKHGAPTTVDLEALLEEQSSKRQKWIQDRTDRKLTDRVHKAVKDAENIEDLHAVLDPVLDKDATPDLVPAGAMILQPSEERRRSGSHYTPRALTEPIVRTTLEPILNRLRGEDGQYPLPEHILDLKVCDPAMGSGAFLVETCRQLGDALINSWRTHDALPEIPEDEDEIVFARRLIAQRCLYGVDRNPIAVDLAKVSIWLVTLAKDHAFTFIDHALRHGDSLVGLTRKQVESFHWKAGPGMDLFEQRIGQKVEEAAALRVSIQEADDAEETILRQLLDDADTALDVVRLLGDVAISAFFSSNKDKEREAQRAAWMEKAQAWLGDNQDDTQLKTMAQSLCEMETALTPFHWEVEFPEVFDRVNGGFDAIVGNPPFLGGRRVRSALGNQYFDWLKEAHEESHGNADLVAHFFRRAFDVLRKSGTFGLIATNTIAQGDTRATGLRWICQHGGEVYYAHKRVRWPGLAAVVVSVLHVIKGTLSARKILDNREVDLLTAFLFHRGGHDDPARLISNSERSFQGSIILGMGFTFDDSDSKGVATPITEMERIIEENSLNTERIFPYIGGEEVNTSPNQSHHRYIINFEDWPLQRENLGVLWTEADRKQQDIWLRRGLVPLDYAGPVAKDFPDLLYVIEEKVKPERTRKKPNGDFALRSPLPQRWWQYADKRPALYNAICKIDRVIVVAQTSNTLAFTFQPSNRVFGHTLVVFPSEEFSYFSTLQSRVHQTWALFFAAKMKDDARYIPSDCFETFPFPYKWQSHPTLETVGQSYYDFRADLMIRNDEGLTKTYNRFHDPEDTSPDIAKLRDLHADMDRAVLDAYGWSDIPTDCEFLLDYEIDEEEWGKRKKPYRYRWPDDIRDEVLARLLELNAERAKEEVRSGMAAAKKQKKKTTKRVKKKSNNLDLFS